MTATVTQLPLPRHYDPKRVGEVYRTPYNDLAPHAAAWAKKYGIRPSSTDKVKIALMMIDVQNTFCIPGFELFVGGRSGTGAVDDNRRLAEFIYRNLGVLTKLFCTLDTHRAAQIFHSLFFVDGTGKNSPPFTMISAKDLREGVWKVNPAIAAAIGLPYADLQAHVIHYADELEKAGKYNLMIWPYHAMLGGIGHALVSAVEEACFFHTVARVSQLGLEVKGGNPLTENYSVLRPEVLTGPSNEAIAAKNAKFFRALMDHDYVAIAGQAKSHCVAWTIEDLLTEILAKDPDLAKKVYLIEDCTSAVVIPGVYDFTDDANKAFEKFKDAGMHVVKSTDPVEDWPDIKL
ncbi:MAG: isochorismatase [Patescibacteria group bacterium]|nr:isochorismatase [Patescibacteria group bacterium]